MIYLNAVQDQQKPQARWPLTQIHTHSGTQKVRKKGLQPIINNDNIQTGSCPRIPVNCRKYPNGGTTIPLGNVLRAVSDFLVFVFADPGVSGLPQGNQSLSCENEGVFRLSFVFLGRGVLASPPNLIL